MPLPEAYAAAGLPAPPASSRSRGEPATATGLSNATRIATAAPSPYSPPGSGEYTDETAAGRAAASGAGGGAAASRPPSVPFRRNTCTRLLAYSATAICPDGPMAMPVGLLNSPSPVPLDPNLRAKVPLGWNTWTRSL